MTERDRASTSRERGDTSPARSSRRARRRRSTRRTEIIRAAGRLFADKGFEATSFRDLGEAVGILRGSFSAHFATKDEILREVLLPMLEHTEQALARHAAGEGDGAQKLSRCVEEVFQCSLEHRDAFVVLLQDRHLVERLESLQEVAAKTRELTEIWLQVVRDGQADGSLRDDVAPALVVRAIYSLLFGVLSDRHVGLDSTTGTKDPDPAALSHLLNVALFQGLRRDPTR